MGFTSSAIAVLVIVCCSLPVSAVNSGPDFRYRDQIALESGPQSLNRQRTRNNHYNTNNYYNSRPSLGNYRHPTTVRNVPKPKIRNNYAKPDSNVVKSNRRRNQYRNRDHATMKQYYNNDHYDRSNIPGDVRLQQLLRQQRLGYRQQQHTFRVQKIEPKEFVSFFRHAIEAGLPNNKQLNQYQSTNNQNNFASFEDLGSEDSVEDDPTLPLVVDSYHNNPTIVPHNYRETTTESLSPSLPNNPSLHNAMSLGIPFKLDPQTEQANFPEFAQVNIRYPYAPEITTESNPSQYASQTNVTRESDPNLQQNYGNSPILQRTPPEQVKPAEVVLLKPAPPAASPDFQNKPVTPQPEINYPAVPNQPGKDFSTEIPSTDFSCSEQRHSGYFADPATNCRIFHVCLESRQWSFLCPNGTIFSQEEFICVWKNQFDCNRAPQLYNLNKNAFEKPHNGVINADVLALLTAYLQRLEKYPVSDNAGVPVPIPIASSGGSTHVIRSQSSRNPGSGPVNNFITVLNIP